MDAKAFLSLVRRRWLPMLLCLLVAVGGAVYRAAETPKTYQSKAKLFINIPAARDTQEALQGVLLSSNLVKSYVQVATSRTTAQRVKDKLGLTESVDAVQHELAASVDPQTVIVTISANNRDPARARDMAQTAAAVLNDTITQLERNRDRSSAIEASIIDNAALPHTAIEPRPMRNLVVGAVLGLLAGLLLALLLEALDRTVKTSADVAAIAGIPALASVPRGRNRRNAVVTLESPQAPASEAYRTLRTAIRFVSPDEPVRTLLVTSPGAGEGKTTTAVNVAVALAQSGDRVALVDADLRRGNLAGAMGLASGAGLSQLIVGAVHLDEVLHTYRDTIDVVPAGMLPPNPSELLGSQSMVEVLERLATHYDTVVIDAPPVMPVTDAVVLAAQVDAVALVVRPGLTQRAHVGETVRRLSTVDARVAGFVLNAVRRPEDAAAYDAYQRVAPVAAVQP